jgi:D-psicose/D-tagatose/L-ribulose 3-epimerase
VSIVHTDVYGSSQHDTGADNIVIHLDTYHMNIEEDDMVTQVRDCGDRLGHVHIGENHRGYPGSGHTDFAAVVAQGLSNDLAIWGIISDGLRVARRHAAAPA